MESNTPPEGLVDQVTRAVADPEHPIELDEGQLTPDVVSRVIVAYQSFIAGEPVGTLKREHTTQSIALRVDDPSQGPCWRVTTTDGSTHTDMRPTLPDWDLL